MSREIENRMVVDSEWNMDECERIANVEVIGPGGKSMGIMSIDEVRAMKKEEDDESDF